MAGRPSFQNPPISRDRHRSVGGPRSVRTCDSGAPPPARLDSGGARAARSALPIRDQPHRARRRGPGHAPDAHARRWRARRARAGATVAHGEDIDRLLDADHAEIVERVSAFLRRHGWEVVPEATFNIYGERGSIDILAFHPLTGSLLVIEVKSAVPDVQATLSGIDRKARLATKVAHDRGWRVGSVSRWLVVPDTTTTRRRIELHSATFGAALPSRTIALRRWAADPTGAVAGVILYLTRPSGPSTRAGHASRIRAQSARNATSHPRGG